MQMLHSLLLLLLLLTTEEGWGKPCMKIGILGEFKTATGKTTSPFGIDIRNGVSLGIQRLKRSGEAVCFEPVEIDINNSISNIPDLTQGRHPGQCSPLPGPGDLDQALWPRMR